MTFRPTLASFSPDRWIPTQRRDPLGLHLVLDSSRPGWVHLITRDSRLGRWPDTGGICQLARVTETLTPAAQSASTLGALLVSGFFGWRHLRACGWVGFSWFQFHRPVPTHTGIEAILCRTYAVAWGAPQSGGLHVDLDEAAAVYAQLSAHYLARPLRRDLPTLTPPAHLQAWHRFPLWGGGVPDEVFIATDGSGAGPLWHGPFGKNVGTGLVGMAAH